MENVNNSYQVYLRSVLDLAGTVIVKSHDSALLLNTYIDTFYGPSLYDPENMATWKYYLNLCGEYFSKDVVMTVRSSDNLEEIEFTKENLAIHRNTALDHRYGTQQYKELVERYPMQVQLILGILYPIDMAKLIAAKNMTVVGWGSEFVEPHEYQLMPNVSAEIAGLYDRYYVEGFKYSDELYLASLIAVIASKIPSLILAERAAAHKTRFAHSYHVLQYLLSHSKVGDYADYMTRTQQLFAYRNIAHIERNSGSQENFDWMIKELLTVRSVPLAKFDMRHDVSEMPTELTAKLLFNKKPINTRTNIDKRNNYNLGQLLDLEERIDPANIPDRDVHFENITRELVYANRDAMPTKVFESTIIDYTDSEKNRWSDIALYNWAWMAHKGMYTAYITFQAPSSGAAFTLSVKDAFSLYVYCYIKSSGYEITELPNFYLNKTARIPAASVAEMRKVCSNRVSDELLTFMHATMPSIRRSISVQAFNQQCHQLFRAANQQWNIVCQCEQSLQRAMAEAAASRMWADNIINLADAPGQTYGDWFSSRNLNMDDYTQEELREIAVLILQRATGADFNDKTSLKSVQRAMTNILTGLSSYSIQIGATINDGPILPSGMIAVRADNYSGYVYSNLHWRLGRVEALKARGVIHHTTAQPGGLIDVGKVTVKVKSRPRIDIPIIPDDRSLASGGIKLVIKLKLNIGLEGKVNPEPLPPDTPKTINVLGMAGWLRQPIEQRSSAKSAWQQVP